MFCCWPTPIAHTPKPSAIYHTAVVNVPDVGRRDVEKQVELSVVTKPGVRPDTMKTVLRRTVDGGGGNCTMSESRSPHVVNWDSRVNQHERVMKISKRYSSVSM